MTLYPWNNLSSHLRNLSVLDKFELLTVIWNSRQQDTYNQYSSTTDKCMPINKFNELMFVQVITKSYSGTWVKGGFQDRQWKLRCIILIRLYSLIFIQLLLNKPWCVRITFSWLLPSELPCLHIIFSSIHWQLRCLFSICFKVMVIENQDQIHLFNRTSRVVVFQNKVYIFNKYDV